MAPETREGHQLFYCGSCKKIGQEFGQVYRAGLNYDLVLMAQVLGHLAGAGLERDEVLPRRCLSRTRENRKAGRLLDFTAALHVFWYHLKLRDHAADEGSRIAGLLADRMSVDLAKACGKLQDAGLDMERVRAELRRQDELERMVPHSIECFAGPTSRITGMVFEAGLRMLGGDELAGDKVSGDSPERYGSGADDTAAITQAGAFGRALGRAIYFQDALTDLKSDRRRGRFNPFLVIATNERTFTGQAWMDVTGRMQELPLPDDIRRQIHARIDRLISGLGGWCGAGSNAAVAKADAKAGAKAVAASCTMSAMPVLAHAQSHAQSGEPTCCSTMCQLLCCLACVIPVCVMVVNVICGVFRCACDILMCFNDYGR